MTQTVLHFHRTLRSCSSGPSSITIQDFCASSGRKGRLECRQPENSFRPKSPCSSIQVILMFSKHQRCQLARVMSRCPRCLHCNSWTLGRCNSIWWKELHKCDQVKVLGWGKLPGWLECHTEVTVRIKRVESQQRRHSDRVSVHMPSNVCGSQSQSGEVTCLLTELLQFTPLLIVLDDFGRQNKKSENHDIFSSHEISGPQISDHRTLTFHIKLV